VSEQDVRLDVPTLLQVVVYVGAMLQQHFEAVNMPLYYCDLDG
jgi:hypothetical protein